MVHQNQHHFLLWFRNISVWLVEHQNRWDEYGWNTRWKQTLLFQNGAFYKAFALSLAYLALIKDNKVIWITHVHKMKTNENLFFCLILNCLSGLFLQCCFIKKMALVNIEQGIWAYTTIPGKSSVRAFIWPPTWKADRESEHLSTLFLSSGSVKGQCSQDEKTSQILVIPSPVLRCHQARWHFLERTMLLQYYYL